MFKDKILPVASVLLAFAAAFFLYLHLPVDTWLFKPDQVISQQEIQADGAQNFTGYPAGDDIPRLQSQADLEAMLYEADYATCTPRQAIVTEVCTLNHWADPYVKRKVNKRVVQTGKRKPSVIHSSQPMPDDYSPYYLLELEDGTYILAQMPQATASAINRGRNVTLPIGQKAPLSQTARSLLADTAAAYDVSLDGALYLFNDDWYADHEFSLTLLRLGISFAFMVVLALILILVGQKLCSRSEKP